MITIYRLVTLEFCDSAGTFVIYHSDHYDARCFNGEDILVVRLRRD